MRKYIVRLEYPMMYKWGEDFSSFVDAQEELEALGAECHGESSFGRWFDYTRVENYDFYTLEDSKRFTREVRRLFKRWASEGDSINDAVGLLRKGAVGVYPLLG